MSFPDSNTRIHRQSECERTKRKRNQSEWLSKNGTHTIRMNRKLMRIKFLLLKFNRWHTTNDTRFRRRPILFCLTSHTSEINIWYAVHCTTVTNNKYSMVFCSWQSINNRPNTGLIFSLSPFLSFAANRIRIEAKINPKWMRQCVNWILENGAYTYHTAYGWHWERLKPNGLWMEHNAVHGNGQNDKDINTELSFRFGNGKKQQIHVHSHNN